MIEVAKAIVTVNGKYALQLRDDKPGIDGRNQWSLFGGRVEEGESVEQGLKRELVEELALEPRAYKKIEELILYSELLQEFVKHHVFLVDFSHEWSHMKLGEGQRAGCFSAGELKGLNMKPMWRQLIEKVER